MACAVAEYFLEDRYLPELKRQVPIGSFAAHLHMSQLANSDGFRKSLTCSAVVRCSQPVAGRRLLPFNLPLLRHKQGRSVAWAGLVMVLCGEGIRKTAMVSSWCGLVPRKWAADHRAGCQLNMHGARR